MDLIFFFGWCILLARKFRQKRKDLQNCAILEVPSHSFFLYISVCFANFWSEPAQKSSLHTTPLRMRSRHAGITQSGDLFLKLQFPLNCQQLLGSPPTASGKCVSNFMRVERLAHFSSVQGTFRFPRELSPCTILGIPHRRSSHEARPCSVHTLYHDAGKTARKRCLDVFLSQSDLPSGMPSFNPYTKQEQRRMEGL